MNRKLIDKLTENNILTPVTIFGRKEKEIANEYRLPDPVWEHDCDNCLFLGIYNNADLYYCPNDRCGPTIISRFSSQDSDYASGILECFNSRYPEACHRELRVAYLIAIDCELIKEK